MYTLAVRAPDFPAVEGTFDAVPYYPTPDSEVGSHMGTIGINRVNDPGLISEHRQLQTWKYRKGNV